jgi:serine/threonine-protein kinase
MLPEHLGRYEIIGELGRGAMGVVYRARDPLIDRIVAVKTIGAGLSRLEAEAFGQRFDREVKSAGRLNHPNIVTIHDVGKNTDGAYIAMEYLDGKSLREILDSGVVLAPQTIADIAAQIAEGLAFAHKNGIVHCDIKPANVMVLANGQVKITDFGIALLPTGSRTVAGHVFGSPKYISPEQVVGRQVDARSDIFSLGAVTYEMLTGVPPFNGADLDDILSRVINETPVAPSTRRRGLSVAFDVVVGKALAKHPNERYQSAQDMADDLRHLASETTSIVAGPLRAARFEASPGDKTVALGTHAATLPGDFPVGPGDAPKGAGSRHVRTALIVALPILAIAIIAGGYWIERRMHRNDDVANDAVASVAPAASGTVRSKYDVGERTEPPIVAAAVAPVSAATPAPVAPAAAQPAVADPAAAKPSGRVTLAVAPWGEIYVDGKLRGVSPPLSELKLPPGKHRIEIRNTIFQPYYETVDVKADSGLRVKHKFQ